MTRPSFWTLAPESLTKPVLEWCLQHHGVDRLMVTARLDRDDPDRSLLAPCVDHAISALFGADILDRRYTSAWPGTRLTDHDGLVVTIAFSEQSIGPMAGAGRLLSDWRHQHSPPLPEDLCLYRQGDPLPVLMSVTHESMAWLITDLPVQLPGAEAGGTDLTEFIPPAQAGFVGPSESTT